ncbi:MAG: hypothetical protein WD156_04085 [Acidimicrobiia bacterium]
MSDQQTGVTRRDVLKRGALFGGALIWATPVVQTVGMQRAQAQVVSPELLFFDDFSQDGPPALNFNAFLNWNVTDGTVDLLAPGPNPYGIPPDLSTTNYVDLDGSTGNAGRLETKDTFLLEVGSTYRLTFALAGNNRNAAAETVTVQLVNGGVLFTNMYTRAENAGFSNETVVIAGAGNAVKIVFDHAGGDNIGLLLDFVRLEQIS